MYQDSTDEKKTKKRKVQDDSALLERVDLLERALCKVATLSGHGNHLKEFGLTAWSPTKKDMTKYS